MFFQLPSASIHTYKWTKTEDFEASIYKVNCLYQECGKKQIQK